MYELQSPDIWKLSCLRCSPVWVVEKFVHLKATTVCRGGDRFVTCRQRLIRCRLPSSAVCRRRRSSPHHFRGPLQWQRASNASVGLSGPSLLFREYRVIEFLRAKMATRFGPSRGAGSGAMGEGLRTSPPQMARMSPGTCPDPTSVGGVGGGRVWEGAAWTSFVQAVQNPSFPLALSRWRRR